ncbi:MAG TPA: hypothetical protein VEB21_06530 [Terriglobales bacterium]|nr:hypothetical protein [Terriglobales bacterium]
MVHSLKVRLKLKSNVEVVRRGLRLLAETTQRRALRDAYPAASAATASSVIREIEELDHLSNEGLDWTPQGSSRRCATTRAGSSPWLARRT